MNRAAVALALLLAACSLPRGPAPHPPTPGVHGTLSGAPRTPCALPPEPVFPDSDAALAAAAGLAERVVRLREGRDARIDYERALRAACR